MDENIWQRLAGLVIRFRWVVIAVFVGALGYFGPVVARNVKNVDNSLGIWFERGDPDYARYNAFKEEFESDELIMVTIEVPEGDVFTPRYLNLIDEISEAVDGIVDVEDVQSIITQNHVRGNDEGLVIEPVVDLDEELTPEALARARELALSEETFVGFLISEKGEVANVAGTIIPTEDKEVKRRIVNDVWAAVKPIEKANPDVTFVYSGAPMFDVAFDDMAVADGEKFFPLTLGLVCIILFIVFRRPSMAILPVIVMGAVITYVWGTYFTMGESMNMAFQMTGSILVAACVADAVHIIAHYYGNAHTATDKIGAIKETLSDMGRPCLFTSVTTAAGFFSFSTSEVLPIQHLGIYAGLGCLFAFVVTVLLIPALLSLLPMPDAARTERYHEGIISRSLESLGRWVERNASPIVSVSAALFVASIFGISMVNVEGNTMAYLSKDHWVRQAITFMQDRLGGLSSFEVIFEGEEDTAKDPVLLRAIDQMQREILEDPKVSNSFSHVNYLKDINQSLNEGRTEMNRVPRTSDMVAQYMLLAETSGDDDINRFVNYDYSKVRVTSRCPATLSKEYLAMMDRAQEIVSDAVGVSGVQANITGVVPLYAKFDRLLLSSQMQSLGLAFFIIYLFMTVLMKSWKIGLLSMIPNGLPIFITLALMGYLNFNLDAATVMIAGIALGIAVDDTVHYLNRFHVELGRADWDYAEASRRATHVVGRPIFFTSVILLVGFGVLVFGNFRPTRMFGYLTGLTMVFALIGDLVLLPALLLKLKPWGEAPATQAEAGPVVAGGAGQGEIA